MSRFCYVVGGLVTLSIGLCAAASNVVELNDSNWNFAGPSSSKGSVFLVKFYAPWCGHCKSLAPTWESLATELKGKVKVAKVDVSGDGSMTGKNLRVQSFPTIMRFENGKYATHKGARSQDALKKWATADANSAPIPEPMGAVEQFGEQMKTWPMHFAKWIEKLVVPFVQSGYAPIILCSFGISALCMLVYTGYQTGRTIKQNLHRPMFIRFGDSKKFVHFGLVSMSPDYILMSGQQLGKDASLSKAQYYVDKNDHSKHQKIPGSLHFSGPALPPPRPPGPPPK